METCKKYQELHPDWKAQVDALIKRICGKSHISDITVEDSEIKSYEFKVTVCKFSSNGEKGWATIGYLRNDLFKGGIWRLTYKPRLAKGEKSEAGRTGTYC